MLSFHGYRVFYSGAVLLVLLCGVCVLAEETESQAAGSSFIIPLGYPQDSVGYAQWKYKGSTFAVYINKQIGITDKQLFGERLKVNSDDVSIEVTDLQISDSGSYSIVAEKPGTEGQAPTKTINLIVYGAIKVEIESRQDWKAATNSCDVSVLCKAPEDQTASYSWSGFKKEDGAQLNFTLTPADGDVTLNCTATSSTGSGSTLKKVTCTPKDQGTDKPDRPGRNIPYWIWIAAGGGVAAFLIIAIIGVSCWWKSHKDRSLDEPGSTVYEDVNVEGTVRKQSMNIASIYETVDEHRIKPEKPQTLYDKVTFARPPASGPSMPVPASHYQHVL